MRSFRKTLFSLAISALFVAAISAGADAQETGLLTAADPETVLGIAKGFGPAELTKDHTGDPLVTGRLQGLKYAIYFYDCEEGENCNSLQFSTGYSDPFTAEQANEWNAKYRWIKAYGGEGSNFKMDVSLEGGVSKANLEDYFSTWDTMMFDLRNFVREE